MLNNLFVIFYLWVVIVFLLGGLAAVKHNTVVGMRDQPGWPPHCACAIILIDLGYLLSLGVTSLYMESLLSCIYTIIWMVSFCDFPDLLMGL